MKTINDMVEAVLARVPYRENPYFTALHDGSFEREDFIETQIQFYMAVIFFSRPMAAVAARIPSAERRVEVVRNIWEEHGEGHARGGHAILVVSRRVEGVVPLVVPVEVVAAARAWRRLAPAVAVARGRFREHLRNGRAVRAVARGVIGTQDAPVNIMWARAARKMPAAAHGRVQLADFGRRGGCLS